MSTPLSQIPHQSHQSQQSGGSGMAMQPGFATDDQLNMVKSRQDAAAQCHIPQDTHMRAEYAPDADDTVIGVLAELQRPLLAAEQPQTQPQPQPQTHPSAQLQTQAVAGAGQRMGWLPTAQDTSLAVLVVLMSVLVGVLPIDRYLAAYVPSLVAGMPHLGLIVRALIVGVAVVLVRRVLG